MRVLILCAYSVSSLALFSCSGGSSLGVPALKPIVEAVTPSYLLLSTQSSLMTSCTETNIYEKVKCRLFSDGPTEILDIIEAIDTRMEEIDTRAQEQKHTCLTSDAVDKTTDFTFPGSETFAHHLQCYDVFSDGTGWMGFGKKDDVWYLREGSEGSTSGVTNGIGKVVKIDADENVEGWIIVGLDASPPPYSAVLLHLKTNKAAGTIEFTAGGENTGFDTVHFKSNATYIYLKDDDGEYCLNSSDYTVATQSLCDTLESGLELTTLGCKGGTGCTAGATTANNVDLTTLYSMGITAITGVPAF